MSSALALEYSNVAPEARRPFDIQLVSPDAKRIRIFFADARKLFQCLDLSWSIPRLTLNASLPVHAGDAVTIGLHMHDAPEEVWVQGTVAWCRFHSSERQAAALCVELDPARREALVMLARSASGRALLEMRNRPQRSLVRIPAVQDDSNKIALVQDISTGGISIRGSDLPKPERWRFRLHGIRGGTILLDGVERWRSNDGRTVGVKFELVSVAQRRLLARMIRDLRRSEDALDLVA